MLAQMRVIDEDALICDFAEYYRIYDFKALDLKTAAILACGLPENSRIMMKLQKRTYTMENVLRAGILDTLRSIEYMYTRVHSEGTIQPPKRIMAVLLGNRQEDISDIRTFDSAEEYEAELSRIREG